MSQKRWTWPQKWALWSKELEKFLDFDHMTRQWVISDSPREVGHKSKRDAEDRFILIHHDYFAPCDPSSCRVVPARKYSEKDKVFYE